MQSRKKNMNRFYSLLPKETLSVDVLLELNFASTWWIE